MFYVSPSENLFNLKNVNCLMDLLVPKSAGSKISLFYIWTVDKAYKVFGLVQLPDEVNISLGISNGRNLFCRSIMMINIPSKPSDST